MAKKKTKTTTGNVVQTHVLKYVKSSDLMQGLPAGFCDEYIEALSRKLTWGDADHTMCSLDYFMSFGARDEQYDEDPNGEARRILVERCKKLEQRHGLQLMIDMEH